MRNQAELRSPPGAIIIRLTFCSQRMSRAPAEIDAHSTPSPHPPGRVADCGRRRADRDSAQARSAGSGPPAPGRGRFLLHQSQMDSDLQRHQPTAPGFPRPRIPEVCRGDGLSVRARSRPSRLRHPLSAELGRRHRRIGHRAALFGGLRRQDRLRPPDRVPQEDSLLPSTTTAASTSTTFRSKAARSALPSFLRQRRGFEPSRPGRDSRHARPLPQTGLAVWRTLAAAQVTIGKFPWRVCRSPFCA